MRYYVYELVIMPDKKVCYVGKGQGRRLYDHLRRAVRPEFKCGQKRLYSRIRDVLSRGKSIDGRIVFYTDDENSAFEEEARRIRLYGFENLFNVASHAFLGRTLKDEVKRDISRAVKKLWSSPGYRRRNRTVLGKKFAYRAKPALRKPKKRRNGKFGKGVSLWSARGMTKFQARICIGGKTVSLGYFASAAGAATAYDNKFEETYGGRPNCTKA